MRSRLVVGVVACAALLVACCAGLLLVVNGSLSSLSSAPVPQITCLSSHNGTPAFTLLVAGESWASGDRLYPELPTDLSRRLKMPVQVCTMGFSGKNTRKIVQGMKNELKRSGLPPPFAGRAPDMVLLLNGVNDQMQHVGASRYADDTAHLAGLFPGVRVKVVSVPRIHFDDQTLPLGLRLKSRLQRMLFDHGVGDPALNYRAALARQHPDVDVIDYDTFMPQFNQAMYRPDGIHLTAEGFHQYGGFLAGSVTP